jgi:hypothetical protein
MSKRNVAIGKRSLIFLVLFSMTCSLALADEGMWLYNSFPKDAVKAKYGFEPTQAWLDHVRLSSVRFNNGASGSFVSSDGLAITNHHVGSQCIHQLSTGGRDYMKTGFYAHSLAEEAKCPDLELNQLIIIEDVTAQVNAAVKPEMSVADAGQARRGAMSGIEKSCAVSTGLRCDVVTLYAGGVYNLYEYKKYTDVRLVFAHRSLTPLFLEAIRIISVIRATISTSPSFASMKMASPPTWTTICTGPRLG